MEEVTECTEALEVGALDVGVLETGGLEFGVLETGPGVIFAADLGVKLLREALLGSREPPNLGVEPERLDMTITGIWVASN